MCQNRMEVSKAMKWLALGLILVVSSTSLPHFFHPAGRFTQDWFDGLRGLMLGIGIGIELMAVIRIGRARRGAPN
jgi:uncharacterized membrane protein